MTAARNPGVNDRGAQMKFVRTRLTYANVVATLALILALGGATAFAASHLARNSVGTKQLRRAAVTAAKLRKGAVNGAKVANNSLTGADVKEATLGAVPSADQAARAMSLGPLPSGASESGFFLASPTFNALATAVTFPRPLASAIQPGDVNVIKKGAQPTTACPAPGQAARGTLCLYLLAEIEVTPSGALNLSEAERKLGFTYEWNKQGNTSTAFGTWTVTVP
jgi:hypothetical protein